MRSVAALCVMLGALLAVGRCNSIMESEEKVDVRFYGESLCPDCTQYTMGTLKAIFKTTLPLVTNFRYIGWGNVRKNGDTYSCQHGPLECKMNTVLNCGQKLSKDQFQFFEFLYCIESQAGPGVDGQIPGCAKLAAIELGELEDCYEGDEGHKLDAAAHNETDSLQPPHTYVPWDVNTCRVTVNGQPIFDAFDNLAVIICASFKGERPAACSNPQQSGNKPNLKQSSLWTQQLIKEVETNKSEPMRVQ